jgi:hypothetical protein
MKRLFPILLSLVCLFPLTSQAVDVDNLYSASVIANGNQSNRTLQKVAFAEVLVKVSGNSIIARNSVIKKALVSARDYLVKQSEKRIEGKRYLQASFNEQKVNRLLRSSQFGVWGKNRPQQVIWLVVDENFNRSVKGESDRQYSAFISAIKQQAETRAIPMLFPVMDLDDQLQVSSADLWGQFTDPIEQASARYGADNYMIAKIIKNVDDYQLSWSLYGRNSKNQPYEIWLNGKSQGLLGPLGIDLANKVANHLGDRYSVKVSGNNETVFLNIDHVIDIKDYAKLIEMFTAMSAVAQADLTAVTGSSIQLKLTLLGTQQDLLKELSLDPRINSVQNAFGDSSFEWAGNNK